MPYHANFSVVNPIKGGLPCLVAVCKCSLAEHLERIFVIFVVTAWGWIQHPIEVLQLIVAVVVDTFLGKP